MAVDYRKLGRYAKVLVLLSLFFAASLHLPGVSREISGAKRWFRIMGFSFQPSEFASLAVIIYTAFFLSVKGNQRIEHFTFGFLPVIVVLGMVSLLILVQPDLGTVIALSMVVLIMLFSAGARLRHILYIGLLAAPALYLLVFSVPYRFKRITAFINPWADPLGSGFQLIQSQVALGSGGIFGKGLGKSMQKLFYLPRGPYGFYLFHYRRRARPFSGFGNSGALCHLFINGAKVVKRASDSLGLS